MLYDEIGRTYAAQRVPDPRIAAQIHLALGEGTSVVNVGAGTGSYEPGDRFVAAIEPSMTMIRQRPSGSASAIQATAESLPIRNGAASAAMALLTVHHWTDYRRGLEELCRIARDRVAILTWDPDGPEFWLTKTYFPAIVARDRQRFPSVGEIARVIGTVRVETVFIPTDCSDGFLGAYWSRPRAYLDAAIRAGMSGFLGLDGASEGLSRLAEDLESGEWKRRHEASCRKPHLDLGYRLVIASLQ